VKNLTFYEQVGILIPGSVLLASIGMLIPTLQPTISGNGVTVGALGLFLILAYAAGQAVAAVGNGLEKIVWLFFGGMPSDWITHDPPKLLTDAQIQIVRDRIRERLGYAIPNITGLPRKQWQPIFRQVYADVLANNPGRVETFNGNYGLNRGLAAALISVMIAVSIVRPTQTALIEPIVALLALIYVYRMYRFAVHFAREVYYAFINPRAAKSHMKNGDTN